MRRSVLIVLLRSHGSNVFVVRLGSVGRISWEIMIEDRLVIVLPGEEIRSCSFCSGLKGMVFAVLGSGLLILVRRTTFMGATVANVCLTTEVVGPAFRKLGAWDVGLEDLVDGSIV